MVVKWVPCLTACGEIECLIEGEDLGVWTD